MGDTATEWRARAREQFEILLVGIAAEWNAQKDTTDRAIGDVARQHLAETLNQGLRRVRLTISIEDAAALLLELSAPFSSRCAVFLFRDDEAHAPKTQGLGHGPIRFSPEQGAAFRAAIETRDPVISVGTPSEISPALAERVGTAEVERVYLFPLTVHGAVHSVLFAAGAVHPAPLELIAGITAMQMESLTPPPALKREDLVVIHGAPMPPAAQAERQSWMDLSPEVQALHLRAQRNARFRVAEIRLEHGEALKRGLEHGDLYKTLREPIDRARDEFRQYLTTTPAMVDYLYLELVRGLAHDNERLLGPDFPGPLV